MIEQSIKRLEFLIDIIPDLLKEVGEPDFPFKPSPSKWSKKQILGHLIDSATNNHQRFVRGQFEDIPVIGYDQNNWNKFSFYDQMSADHLITFWTIYNKHILEVVKRISPDDLNRKCRSLSGNTHTLEFLIEDYVAHLEHHLKQMVTY